MTLMQPGRDWKPIEADYRAGIKTVRAIAREYGLSDTAINKKAKAEGWTRNLDGQIRAAAAEKVRRASLQPGLQERAQTEAAIVDSESDVLAKAEALQRTGTAKLFGIIDGLADELIEASTLRELPKGKLRELLLQAIRDGELNDDSAKDILRGIRDLLDRGDRTDTAKKLVESWGKLTDTQRRILKMDADGKSSSMMDLLREMLDGG